MIYLKVSGEICDYKFLKDNIKDIFSEILNYNIYKKRFELYNFKIYFKDKFNLSLNQFFDKLENSLDVRKLKKENVILLNSNEKLKDKRLEELISFIDYGNRSVKGCGLIRDTIEYIKNNFRALIFYQAMKLS